MSGIAGIFYRNNQPVQPEQLQTMGKALAHRGPDGIRHYRKTAVGFVHCMLYDTPESLLETLPNRTEDDNFVVTFDGRIDNRRELYDKIGLGKPLTAVTDSDLVLAAYRKWRSECVYFLLGDFAFAVWDQIERRIFCARDHMGVKPFYYHLTDKIFVFASEIKALVTLQEVPQSLNEVRVADFLTKIVTDKEATFYNNIFHLPPAHFLEINAERSRLCCYYNFVAKPSRYKNRSQFEEGFREIFTEAVRCRVRSAFPVGAYLSGGLDSSSIVCTAAGALQNELPGGVDTFSGIFDIIKECDERQYLKSVIERYGLRHHFLHADSLYPGAVFDEFIGQADEPPFSPHFFMKWHLTCMSKNAGMRVMLDGHDGDSAVSYGIGLFRELALQGNVPGMIKEYKAYNPAIRRLNLIKKILRIYLNICCERVPIISFVSKEKKRLHQSLGILNTNFKKKINFTDRLSVFLRNQPLQGLNEREYHRRNVTHPLQPYMFEFLERLGSHFATVLRFPYSDKRVIDFCLSLPSNEKFTDGFNRSIVRRSLADYLPKPISERKTKTDFSPNLIHAFSTMDGGWLVNALDNLPSSTYNFTNNDFLGDYARKFFQTKGDLREVNLYLLIRAISLNKWLEKNTGF